MIFFNRKEKILINDLSNHVAELYQWIGLFLCIAHPKNTFQYVLPTENEFEEIMDECIELLDRADPYYIEK